MHWQTGTNCMMHFFFTFISTFVICSNLLSFFFAFYVSLYFVIYFPPLLCSNSTEDCSLYWNKAFYRKRLKEVFMIKIMPSKRGMFFCPSLFLTTNWAKAAQTTVNVWNFGQLWTSVIPLKFCRIWSVHAYLLKGTSSIIITVYRGVKFRLKRTQTKFLRLKQFLLFKMSEFPRNR